MKLSICIPIYNCADFIGQALDSIMPQAQEGIEVIIYDGGSTDGTESVVERYVRTYANLHYHRGVIRGGIDADMVKCVEFATGAYCWLFSGDDVMRPGAINRALEWIKHGYDVLICKHTICSKSMVVSHEHPVLLPDKGLTANLANSNERLQWFKHARTTEAFFSFISGLVVRREKWSAGELPNTFSKSCWGHVARFFGLISSGLTVCYVGEVWLDQRGGNDSFADKGIVNRFRIGIEGYHKLADAYFGHASIEAFHIRKAIRNEFSLKSFVFLKIHCMLCPERESQVVLDQIVRMTYCDNSLAIGLKRSIYFYLTPYWLIATARFAYQPIKIIRRVLNNA